MYSSHHSTTYKAYTIVYHIQTIHHSLTVNLCQSVRPILSGAQLFPIAGVVLVPFWICEYDLHGQQYRAFMNGVTGKTVGATHVDQGKAQLTLAACAACVSVVCAYVAVQSKSQFGVMIALALPVAGWFGGGMYS